MAVLSAITAAAAAIGAAGQYNQYLTMQQAQKDQKKAMKEQEARALAEARRKPVGTETGAKVKVGAAEIKNTTTKGTAKRTSTTGVGGFQTSASKIGGL